MQSSKQGGKWQSELMVSKIAVEGNQLDNSQVGDIARTLKSNAQNYIKI